MAESSQNKISPAEENLNDHSEQQPKHQLKPGSDVVTVYWPLIALFILFQFIGYLFTILQITETVSETVGYIIVFSTLVFDVAFCQILFLGTLHYGEDLVHPGIEGPNGEISTRLEWVCRTAFLLDCIVFVLNLTLIERPLNAKEAADNRISENTEMINTIDACIWAAVCSVSAWVGIQALVVGRMRLSKKWFERGGKEEQYRMSNLFMKVYGVCLVFILGLCCGAVAVCVAADEDKHKRNKTDANEAGDDLIRSSIQGKTLLTMGLVFAQVWGMKSLLFDASNTNNKVLDVLPFVSSKSRTSDTSAPSPVPRSLKTASLCLSLFLIIPFILVFIVFSSKETLPTDGAGVQGVDWAIRINLHIGPAFIVWLCACYNLGMQPGHLFSVEGTEKRLAEKAEEKVEQKGDGLGEK